MSMTIENISGAFQSGNVEQLMDRGQQIQAPEVPSIEGLPNGSSPEKSFGEMLGSSIEKVNDMQLQADRGAKELAAGRNKNIHETMLMMEKADMSFRLMMQVRNKMIDAYREIMRMQV